MRARRHARARAEGKAEMPVVRNATTMAMRHAQTLDMAEWCAVALGAALALGLWLLWPILAHAAVI
jgi:hypothetical protein